MRAKPTAPGATGVLLDALAAHVDKVLDAHDDFGRRTRWRAKVDSPLEEESQRMKRHYGPGGDWRGEQARHAGEIASLFSLAAAQHLDAIRVLLENREVIFSLAPLSRSVLEITGHTFWLLDTAVHNSPRRRAARVVLAQIDDATRRVTAAKQVHHTDVEAYVKHLRRLRRDVVPSMFYPSEIEVDGSGRLTLCGEKVPRLGGSFKYIEAVTGVDWNTTGMYAYLSNASHPTYHVVRDAYVFDEVTGKGSFVADDARLPYLLTRAALMSFIRTWQINAKYRGLDAEEA